MQCSATYRELLFQTKEELLSYFEERKNHSHGAKSMCEAWGVSNEAELESLLCYISGFGDKLIDF